MDTCGQTKCQWVNTIISSIKPLMWYCGPGLWGPLKMLALRAPFAASGEKCGLCDTGGWKHGEVIRIRRTTQQAMRGRGKNRHETKKVN